MPSYRYQRLDGGSKQIRLFNLQPGSFDDDLKCEIFHTRLEALPSPTIQRPSKKELEEALPKGWIMYNTTGDRYIFLKDLETTWTHPNPRFAAVDLSPVPAETAVVKYEALSYTWEPLGEPGFLYVVDGEGPFEQGVSSMDCIQIGENLESALRHLRLESEPRTMWVDAVCINQNNEVERGEQVSLMADIYRLADRVVAWLGPEKEDCGRALETLEHLSSQAEVAEGGILCSSPNAAEEDWHLPTFKLNFNEDVWLSIDALLDRPWFSRLWVLQEIQLANDRAILRVGPYSAQVSRFVVALEVLRAKIFLPPCLGQALVNYATNTIAKTGSCPFNMLVTFSQARFCSDPRDKVFAVLGLASPGFRKDIKPDYLKPVPEVYKDAFLTYIRHTRSLNAITGCREEREDGSWPSWLPDWSVRPAHLRIVPHLSSGFSCTDAHLVGSRILEVTGLQSFSIASVAGPAPRNVSECFFTMKQWYNTILRACAPTDSIALSDSCAVALSAYLLRERFPFVIEYPTLAEWKQLLSSDVPSDGEGQEEKAGKTFDEDDPPRAAQFVARRTLMIFGEGFVGLGPTSAQPGDILCVILGCTSPILLRETDGGRYMIVGECAVNGFEDANLLLGRLPAPWRIMYELSSGYQGRALFLNDELKVRTYEDPRLPPLQPPWERSWSPRTGDDPELFQRFKNTATGETMNSDPRMLPEALRARGIPLRTFQLV